MHILYCYAEHKSSPCEMCSNRGENVETRNVFNDNRVAFIVSAGSYHGTQSAFRLGRDKTDFHIRTAVPHRPRCRYSLGLG